jgi:hypothetical protein
MDIRVRYWSGQLNQWMDWMSLLDAGMEDHKTNGLMVRQNYARPWTLMAD